MISATIFNSRGRNKAEPKLSLVSLMDIFTILVFFLLLNSGEAQKLEHATFVKLPNSSKGNVPHEEMMITVNAEEIWVDKEKIANVEDVLKGPEDFIAPLEKKLIDYKKKREEIGQLTPYEKENGFAIVIMGDQKVPYVLLKSVMATCRKHEFLNISLAVNRIADGSLPSALPPPAGANILEGGS